MKNKLLSGVDDIEYKGEDNEWLVHVEVACSGIKFSFPIVVLLL